MKMTKKDKLKKLLNTVNSLESKKNIDSLGEDFDNLTSRLLKEESERISSQLSSSSIVKLLNKLSLEINRVKDGFDIQPIIQEIQNISNDTSLKDETRKAIKELEYSLNEVRAINSRNQIEIATFPKQLKSVEARFLETLNKAFSQLKDEIPKESERIIVEKTKENSFNNSINEDKLQELEDKIDQIQLDLINRISNRGGGSANQKISINGSVMSNKYADVNFLGNITKSDNNLTKQVDITFAGGGGSVLALQVNGVPNVNQGLLNLVQGTNITITDNGNGSVTFDASGGAGSGITRTTSIITANTTGSAAPSIDRVYFATGLTFTLPTAVGNTNLYTVKNVGNSSVMVATTGGQTIDGSVNAPIYLDNQALDFISDNANWQII